MQSGASRYGYRPLRQATDEIRVFELLPAQSFEAKLEGTLREVSLKSKHQYEALSYVWGPPIFDHEVEIEGRTLPVTLNLDNALRYLRRSDSSRMLWVDAICIDQANLEERSQQVTMMKNIFESCDRCIAWLGPFVQRNDEGPPTMDDEALKLAATGFEVFRAMYERDEQRLQTMERRMKERKGKDAKSRFRDDSAKYPDDESPNLPDQETEYILQDDDQWALSYVFAENDLWSRMWIVQELSCAPRVQLMAGHQTLELEDVLSFLEDESISDAFHGTFSHDAILGISRCFPHPKAVQQQRSRNQKAFSEGNSSSSLIDTLARFRHAKATDPRDMIYGLLGLVTEKHNVSVGYQKTVAQVFTETTKAIIDATGNLDIICQNPWAFPRDRPRVEGLPSWVVDFTNRESALWDFEELLFAQRGIFKAGKPNFPVPCETIDGRGLPVRGSIIGRLGKRPAIADYKFWYSVHKRLQINAMRAYLSEDLSGSDAPTYAATGESQRQAFWRTVAMDCKAYPITRLSAEEIADTTVSFETICRAEETEYSWDDPLTQVFRRLHSYGMYGRQENRWSFTMADSGLFAMVRQNVMEGDVFAVLDGGKVPMVLRPVENGTLAGDCFEIVSPAYVHGFMDGEAQIGVSKGEITEKSIMLV